MEFALGLIFALANRGVFLFGRAEEASPFGKGNRDVALQEEGGDAIIAGIDDKETAAGGSHDGGLQGQGIVFSSFLEKEIGGMKDVCDRWGMDDFFLVPDAQKVITVGGKGEKGRDVPLGPQSFAAIEVNGIFLVDFVNGVVSQLIGDAARGEAKDVKGHRTIPPFPLS